MKKSIKYISLLFSVIFAIFLFTAIVKVIPISYCKFITWLGSCEQENI